MAHLPTELLKYILGAGGVSLLIGAIGYVGKKVIDVVAAVAQARVLKEEPKRPIVRIYGPDQRVVKRVEVDYE
jgi:hypothetical protein